MQIVLNFIVAYWPELLISTFFILVIVYLAAQAVKGSIPKDLVGNGITIGKPKAFDNRSLQLRIERLSAGLAALKVVNQNLTENLSLFQEQTSSESNRSLTLGVKSSPGKVDNETSSKTKDGDKKAESASALPANPAKAESKSSTGLSASDILSDQLNLAAQIMNLELLYERSLSDRLIDGRARLQTVVGFQISITPPAGYQNCVAVAEVGVRVKGKSVPVSLVALIPQEKTYNAQSVTNSAQSIGGSAVASVLTLGFSSKGESRQLFIHRDSDTIAFERDPGSQPTLFNDDTPATVFGWEFRPVLGRSTVSAGTRQMLAVIAVPREEQETADEVTLEIRTRSYWRRYNRKKQTSRPRWCLPRFKVDGSNRIDSALQELAVPNTAKIQDALAPRVTDIKWVNSGADRATVIVKGSNLFSGTRVVMGGSIHREEDGSLTLKSDQALEFETRIASLAVGDSVLSGRFGSSFRLEVPKTNRPVDVLSIVRVTVRPSRYTKAFRVTVDIGGIDENGLRCDLTTSALQKLPEPILFVGTEPVAMPYDYEDIDPNLQSSGSGTGGASGTGGSQQVNVAPGTAKYVRVGAWIPAKTLGRSASVTFRVPFCGSDYQASLPLSFAEPTVTRMGSNATNSVFRIAHPLGFGSSVSVDVDRTYAEGTNELKKTSDVDFRFELPTEIISQYQNLVVRIGTAEPYLLPIPMKDRPKVRARIDDISKPPEIVKSGLGPLEWSGSALDMIIGVTLYTNSPPGTAAPAGGTLQQMSFPAQFATYDNGKRIVVVFSAGSTDNIGRADVEFQTLDGDMFRLPVFITKPPSTV